jgi:Tol biopolymer transport system component
LDRWGKISADGKFVVFVTCSKNFAPTASGYNYHVYLHNMATGTTDMIDTGLSGAMPNDTAYEMSTDISADGRYVVFGSNATNLVSNGHNGIFVRDTKLNTTTLVSDSYNGTTPNGTSDRPSISCDGSLIVFSSTASNLVSGDTNSLKDVFLVNRIGGYSIKDLTLNANAESGATYGWPLTAKVSCDGSTVLLSSKATNLASGVTGTNVHSYVYDTYDETLELIDQTTGGTLANGSVQDEAISGDGNLVVYQSPATNLDSVSSDTNSTSDIFIRDRSAGTTYRISKQNSTTELSSGGTEQSAPAISPDGRYVTYISGAANAVSGDTNNLLDVFVTPTGLTPTNY